MSRNHRPRTALPDVREISFDLEFDPGDFAGFIKPRNLPQVGDAVEVEEAGWIAYGTITAVQSVEGPDGTEFAYSVKLTGVRPGQPTEVTFDSSGRVKS